ncbi:MAG TPA: hypothetical protein GXX20_10235 [Clostridiaceae bacterium]|nr:hypothetical protein [Clostridiaceae bacterium]
MEVLLQFANMHRYFVIIILFFNFMLSSLIMKKMQVHFNRYIYEALGGRDEKKALHVIYISVFRDILSRYERRSKNYGFYKKIVNKMKKSGYSYEKAPMIYFALKFVLLPLLFIAFFIINYPDIIKAAAATTVIFIIMELVILARKKAHNLKLQKNIYKIYKYLHNQISSGVRVTDAVKTVYEVIEDKKLRNILIRLAATYELTLDIDKALGEFKSNYDTPESETLCVALKQGVLTGDNRELLARQEDIMFNKYFYYIQAETDNCRFKSAAAVGLFCSVIVIMILIPMIMDVTDAVRRIFI